MSKSKSKAFSLSIPLKINGVQRILISEAWNATPHLETGIEIAIRFAQAGHRVDYLHYGTILPFIECGKPETKSLKSTIIGYPVPQSSAMSFLSVYARTHSLPIRILRCSRYFQCLSFQFEPSRLQSLDILKSSLFRGSNMIGLGVASTLVDISKNSAVIPLEHGALVNKISTSFVRAYHVTSHALRRSTYDIAIIFNGRFASVKGAAQAILEAKIPLLYHERGCDEHHFTLTSYQPHDRVALQQQMLEIWKAADLESRDSIASSYFQRKRQGCSSLGPSFVSHQRSGLSRTILSAARQHSKSEFLITYFTSSDDEFLNVDDVFSPSIFEWTSQREALAVLAEISHSMGHALIVRVHPNLETKSQVDRDAWNSLSFLRDHEHITIITSDSPVSSYELIDGSDLVITSGSTVGIESVYAATPTVILADCIYDCIGAAVQKVYTKSQLIRLLTDPSSLMTDPTSSYPYGYFVATFGIPYEIFKPTGYFSGLLGGRTLPNYVTTPSRRRQVFNLSRSLLSKFPR